MAFLPFCRKWEVCPGRSRRPRAAPADAGLAEIVALWPDLPAGARVGLLRAGRRLAGEGRAGGL
jgi:hypothetical protein